MREDARPDVAVVGVGSIGAMVLWQLAQRGVTAVGYDSFAPGHDRGAAGGESRILRAVPRQGELTVPLLRRALDLWRELERDSGRRLLHPTGSVTVAPAGHPSVSAIQDTARVHDLPLETLYGAEAAWRVPEHPLRAGEVLLLDPGGGLLRPEASVLAAAERAETLGARIHRYTPVVDVRDEGDSAVVLTAHGAQRYARVIVSPGPWVRQLPLLRASPLIVKMVTAMWFARRHADSFVPERTPVAMRFGDPELSCCPGADGAKIVPRDQQRGDIGDPGLLPRTVSVETTARVSEEVRRIFPSLHPDPIRISTYSDAYAADGHGLLGPAEEGSAVVVATGFSGRGFQFAPIFGAISADLGSVGSTPHDIGFLSPTRPQPESDTA